MNYFGNTLTEKEEVALFDYIDVCLFGDGDYTTHINTRSNSIDPATLKTTIDGYTLNFDTTI